jgi:hypothetical protein
MLVSEGHDFKYPSVIGDSYIPALPKEFEAALIAAPRLSGHHESLFPWNPNCGHNALA